jgi:hypothetical protein
MLNDFYKFEAANEETISRLLLHFLGNTAYWMLLKKHFSCYKCSGSEMVSDRNRAVLRGVLRVIFDLNAFGRN